MGGKTEAIETGKWENVVEKVGGKVVGSGGKHGGWDWKSE